MALDGKFLTAVRSNPVAVADAFAHEVRGLLKQMVACPTQEEYARALFESDPEVVRFVRSVADDVIEDGPHVEWKFGERRRAMQIAWDRNEGGWRDRAEVRAFELMDALDMGRRGSPSGGEGEKG